VVRPEILTIKPRAGAHHADRVVSKTEPLKRMTILLYRQGHACCFRQVFDYFTVLIFERQNVLISLLESHSCATVVDFLESINNAFATLD